MAKVVIRSMYGYDAVEASEVSALGSFDPSQTVQSDFDDADLNSLIARFGLEEVVRDVPMPSFSDFTDVVDFSSAMNAIVKGRESFNAMPAKVRSRFDNDPQRFLEFCEDPSNYDEALRLGLVRVREPAKRPAPEPDKPK